MKKKLVILVMSFLAVGLSACSKETKKTVESAESSAVAITEEETFERLSNALPEIEYNQDDYFLAEYKPLLRDPLENAGLKIRMLNANVLQVLVEGKFTKLLVIPPTNDTYMMLIETERLESKILEDDTLHFNGRFLTTYSYTAVNSVEKEVPLIYIDGYALLDD